MEEGKGKQRRGGRERKEEMEREARRREEGSLKSVREEKWGGRMVEEGRGK